MYWYWLVAIGLAAVVVIWVVFYKKTPSPPHDTFYFCVVDKDGVKSCNHDSGIKPSASPQELKFIALKKEYNDGKENVLNGIGKVFVGKHYSNMKIVKPTKIVDEIDWYEIYVAPNDCK